MCKIVGKQMTCLVALALATGSYGHLLPLEVVVRESAYGDDDDDDALLHFIFSVTSPLIYKFVIVIFFFNY